MSNDHVCEVTNSDLGVSICTDRGNARGRSSTLRTLPSDFSPRPPRYYGPILLISGALGYIVWARSCSVPQATGAGATHGFCAAHYT